MISKREHKFWFLYDGSDNQVVYNMCHVCDQNYCNNYNLVILDRHDLHGYDLDYRNNQKNAYQNAKVAVATPSKIYISLT